MLRRAYVKLHSAHEAGIMEDSIWGKYTWFLPQGAVHHRGCR